MRTKRAQNFSEQLIKIKDEWVALIQKKVINIFIHFTIQSKQTYL